ncbi:hypothetical protein [Heyndrickxia oleronia]|nr:hypothetical protein [Heyndrickxia oleronia]
MEVIPRTQELKGAIGYLDGDNSMDTVTIERGWLPTLLSTTSDYG